jgi:hypothetical protein
MSRSYTSPPAPLQVCCGTALRFIYLIKYNATFNYFCHRDSSLLIQKQYEEWKHVATATDYNIHDVSGIGSVPVFM